MNFQQLLHDIKHFTIDYYDAHSDPSFYYHNIEHTKRVVHQAGRIADHYQLSDEDHFIIIAAAWFHDLGYFIDKSNHEEKSAVLAAEHLRNLRVDEAIIEQVKGCILATKMPQHAVGLLQEIVCDADLYHLGTDLFADTSKLLRKEIEAVKNISIDKNEWRKKNIEMLTSHRYYTDFVRLEVKDQYEKNLQKLLNKQAEETSALIQETKNEQPSIIQPPAQQEKKSKADKPERGIETMFRITSGNNQRLSDMADNKAQILITVNSIILSAIISLVLRKLEESSFLTIPTFMLLTISLASMIFAILATRPSIPSGIFTQEDIDTKRVNLLFFGNFYKMHLEEYSAGMQKVMDDKDFLYGTLIRDVYSQGVVLGRKYHLLRLAYNVFMFGLIVAVLAFIIASIINNHLDVKSR